MQSTFLAVQLSEEDLLRRSARVKPQNGQTIISAVIDSCLEASYDLACLPLTNSKWHSRWQEMCIDTSGAHDGQLDRKAEIWRSGGLPLLESEVVLGRLEETSNVIANASEWISLDAPDEWVRLDSELALEQELAWASYLNIGTVILPPPQHREYLASYARAVNAALTRFATSRIELSIRIPVYDPRTKSNSILDAPSVMELLSLSWETWDLIRLVCDYHPRLSLSKSFSHQSRISV